MSLSSILKSVLMMTLLLSVMSAHFLQAVSIHSNPFLYSQEYTDPESHLQYLNARYYDSSIQRFVARDTYALINRYSYGNDNPIRNRDPSGHIAIPSWLTNYAAPSAGIVMSLVSTVSLINSSMSLTAKFLNFAPLGVSMSSSATAIAGAPKQNATDQQAAYDQWLGWSALQTLFTLSQAWAAVGMLKAYLGISAALLAGTFAFGLVNHPAAHIVSARLANAYAVFSTMVMVATFLANFGGVMYMRSSSGESIITEYQPVGRDDLSSQEGRDPLQIEVDSGNDVQAGQTTQHVEPTPRSILGSDAPLSPAHSELLPSGSAIKPPLGPAVPEVPAQDVE